MHKQTFKSARLIFLLICSQALLLAGCVTTGPVENKVVKEIPFPGPPDQARFFFERTLRSPADVKPKAGDDESIGLRQMVTGETDTGGKGFGKPYGIAAHDGRIYISDTVNRAVLMLDPEHGLSKDIGKEDPGSLVKPMGLDVDGKGNLYVMDATKKWVLIYDRDGKYLRSVGGPDYFDRPSSVAVNREGTRLFAVDTGGSRGKPEFHRVQAFDALSGKHLFSIGTRGNEKGQLNLARDAKVGPDNLLYVVDGGNFRVQVFDQDGKFVRMFGSVGRRLGQFARPKGIAVDPEGNVFISDASHANFQIFSAKGDLLMFIGTRGSESEPAQYLLPAMITSDRDGRIYLVDQGYRKVDVYRPARLKKDEGFLGVAFKKLETLKPKSEEDSKESNAKPKGGDGSKDGSSKPKGEESNSKPKGEDGSKDVNSKPEGEDGSEGGKE